MEYANKKKMLAVRNTVRYKADANVTYDLLYRSIKHKIKEYGLDAHIDNCSVSNGLFGEDENALAVVHPQHTSDYFKYCIICNKVGTTATVDVYTFGQSSNMKHEEYAANTKIFTGNGARGAAVGMFRGGAFGVGAAAGSIIGSAVGAGFRAIGKGINALMRDEAGLEREVQWYSAMNDILSEILDYGDFCYQDDEADNCCDEELEYQEVDNIPAETETDNVLRSLSVDKLKEAVAQGDTWAMGALGVKYYLGEDVGRNRALAFELFEKAAKADDITSQKYLGLCYLLGEGIEKNERKVYIWFCKASDGGNAEAKVRLAELLINGEKIAHDYALAESLYKEVIGLKKKIVHSYNFLKEMSSPQLYVDKNTYNDAVWGLAVLYTDFYRYYSKAFPLLKESAENGYAEAQYYLGIAYMYARGTESNADSAKYWLQKAVEQGHSSAEYHLNKLESN